MASNYSAWARGAVLFLGLLPFAGPAAEVAGQRIDACALLLDGEIRKAIGQDVHAGERHDMGEVAPDIGSGKPSYSSTCLWRIKSGNEEPLDPNDPVAGTSFVMVNAIRWSTGVEGAKHYLQSFRDAAEDGTIDHQPSSIDIGDEALWWGDGVALRKSETSVGVSVHLPGDRRKERLLEEALAKIVARRTPR